MKHQTFRTEVSSQLHVWSGEVANPDSAACVAARVCIDIDDDACKQFVHVNTERTVESDVLWGIIKSGTVELPSGATVPLHSGCTYGRMLYKLITERRHLCTLEVGCAYGISAMYFLQARCPHHAYSCRSYLHRDHRIL